MRKKKRRDCIINGYLISTGKEWEKNKTHTNKLKETSQLH